MEISLRDLIARLPIPGLKESTDRHTAASILSSELGVPLLPKQIQLKDSILTVSVPPVVKSAIQMKQIRLIEILKKEGISVSTIR